MVKVEWFDFDVEPPEEEGVYLTYWSDGALETYRITEDDIAKGYVTSGNDALLCWAENVEPPERFAV